MSLQGLEDQDLPEHVEVHGIQEAVRLCEELHRGGGQSKKGKLYFSLHK